MGKRPLAHINPEMLVWARKERGYDIETAAKKIRISPEKLKQCEKGENQLTMRQLRDAAWVYRRPTAIFYLKKTPPNLQIPEFRRLPEAQDDELSPELRLAIRRIYQKRNAAIDLKQYAPSFNWDYVSSISTKMNPEILGIQIRKMLNVDDRFPIGLRDYQAFYRWREGIENVGTLVMQIPGIDVSEMRGFSIAESPFPVIAVNRSDSYPPRIFTLLHEFCHVLLGSSSVCQISGQFQLGSTSFQKHEVFCNQVAAAAIIPQHLLMKHKIVKNHGVSPIWTDDELQAIASRFRVSKDSVLRRLLTVGKTTKEYYGSKRQKWKEKRKTKEKSGGYEKYHERVLRLDGRTLPNIILDAMHDQAITYGDVSELLDIRLKHLPKLEAKLAEG